MPLAAGAAVNPSLVPDSRVSGTKALAAAHARFARAAVGIPVWESSRRSI